MQNLNNKILTTSIALNTLAYIINYENICLPS